MKKEYLYLIIGIVIGVAIFLFLWQNNSQQKEREIFAIYNNINPLLSEIAGDVYLNQFNEFWANNEIIKVEFIHTKINLREDSTEIAEDFECKENFEKRDYLYSGEDIQYSFCKLRGVKAGNINPPVDLDYGVLVYCECWYIK